MNSQNCGLTGSYSPASYNLSTSNYLLSFNDSEKLIGLGEFNFPDTDLAAYSSSYPLSLSFCDIAFKLNLTQLIDVPTHIAGNILDVVLTNTDAIYNVSVNSKFPPGLSSDHFMITFSLQTSLNSPAKVNQKYTYDYFKDNWEGMNHYLL